MRAKFNMAVVSAVALMTVLGAPAMAQSAGMKVGVLDFGRLMRESPQFKVLADSLRAEATAKERELQTQAGSLKAKADKLQKDRATMSPEQVTRAERELRDGERDLARKEQEFKEDFNARQNEEMGKLQQALVVEARAYADGQNFDLVVTEGNVIYATSALDITPGVLQALQAKAAAPKPPAAR